MKQNESIRKRRSLAIVWNSHHCSKPIAGDVRQSLPECQAGEVIVLQCHLRDIQTGPW